MRPLYKSAANSKLEKGTGNTGLWYDKFCHTWPKKEWSLQNWKEGKKTVNPKIDWMKTVTAENMGDRALLAEACQRQAALAKSCDMEVIKYATVWRFITGLGRQHPVENGFAWHHTLGVPYLPGSSVKGMVRTWAEQWENIRDGNRIFGDKDKKVAAGNVIFLDALPLNRVVLELDVMTPHYSPYYRDSNSKPPGDWYDPTPIPFLTVASGQVFQFGVLPRKPRDGQSRSDAERVLKWLGHALENIGAGAKTAVGYGRFKKLVTVESSVQSEEWKKATVKYTPSDGKFTVINRATRLKASCPAGMRSPMKDKVMTLSKRRQNMLKGEGLPCTAKIIKQGNMLTVQSVIVMWTGENTEKYEADK